MSTRSNGCVLMHFSPSRGASYARVVLLAMAFGVASAGAQAHEPPAKADDDETRLSKATQNPVSDLVSIPFQWNFFTGGGLGSQTLYNMNFQPVFPLPLGKKWTLISRSIVPTFNVPGPGVTRFEGMGDILQQFFVTPAKPAALIWGVGPIFSFPTATNEAVSTGDWATGPAAVALRMTGPWVCGALVYQLWTFAGDDVGENVNTFALQPFINYNLAHGWSIVTAPIFTANWNLDDVWTIPLGLGVSKVTKLGPLPVLLGIQYYANVHRPPSSGSSQLKLISSFLFPAK